MKRFKMLLSCVAFAVVLPLSSTFLPPNPVYTVTGVNGNTYTAIYGHKIIHFTLNDVGGFIGDTGQLVTVDPDGTVIPVK